MTIDQRTAALGRALEFFGDHKSMAKALGVTPKALWGARERGQVNAKMANLIHQVTGGNIRREELRPDLFPRRHHHRRVWARRRREQQR